jgi:hypothetical protein
MPPTPQEWSALAKRGGDPVLLERKDGAILDSHPIFVVADDQMRCLDTDEVIASRESARVALADSLQSHAGLSHELAKGLVNSIFVQQHPDKRYARHTVLDPGMLPVAASLFEHQETASRLASFSTLRMDDRQRELAKLRKEIPTLESLPSPKPPPPAMTDATLRKQNAFSVLLLAHLRLVRTKDQETVKKSPDDSMREMWRCAQPTPRQLDPCLPSSSRTRTRSTVRQRIATLRRWPRT